MGTSHAATGVLTGAGVGVLLQADPLSTVTCALIGGGAALLPDLDEPGSTAGRSLGRVTELLSRRLRDASRAVYGRTATAVELRRPQEGGHRYLTHTLPACAVFGALAGTVALVPLGAGLVVFALAALGLGTVLRSARRLGSPRKRERTAVGVAGILGACTLLVDGYGPPAWLVGLLVFAGALTHVLGDWLTRSGVPLAWPFVVRGRRWWMFRSPVPFTTGESPVETGIRTGSLIITPIMVVWGGTALPPV
ncbi:metal-dependent hydrolase [Nocardiopsis halotolerans]|uniref:metal-dependent hydrolase n=1 Tax=Nocardiopsis halotolerans TaxID=124252 RepID=UPI003084095B